MLTPEDNANQGDRFTAYSVELTLNKNTEIIEIPLNSLAGWTNNDDVNCPVTS
jgi:hypothetical protein